MACHGYVRREIVSVDHEASAVGCETGTKLTCRFLFNIGHGRGLDCLGSFGSAKQEGGIREPRAHGGRTYGFPNTLRLAGRCSVFVHGL